jgi:3'(2'), 5'-bisphosphate nucleotidase
MTAASRNPYLKSESHMQYAQFLVDSIQAALAAGRAVLDVYDSDFEVEAKADKSPLTLADRQSHTIIKSGLSRHGIPVISEEGRDIPYHERKQWDTIWIVDPLDGTKEFVKRNGEFTVNIALVEGVHPVLGVVYAPVPDVLYFATRQIGAYKAIQGSELFEAIDDSRHSPEQRLDAVLQRARKLPCGPLQPRAYTIVGSRSHGGPELTAFVERKRAQKGALDFIQAGSSLKICLVAEGAADIYPRLGPTMEWDTAAGQAVAECAGADVYAYESRVRLHYNKEDLLNPWFVVERA